MSISGTLPAERLALARGYPYAIPGTSYLLTDEAWQPLAGDSWHAHTSGRVPVLALGSNRSPEQLARKFPGPGKEPIPVVLASLAGFDVVYSAHITRYGSVPATLHPAPGAEVAVSVTWLTERQLDRMHETEALGVNYDYGRLSGISATLQGGRVLTEAFTYIGRRGALAHAGTPLGLAAAPARGRCWRESSQDEVQALIRDRLVPSARLDDFVLAQIDEEETRQARTQALARDAIPFAHAGFEVLLPAAAESR